MFITLHILDGREIDINTEDIQFYYQRYPDFNVIIRIRNFDEEFTLFETMDQIRSLINS